MEKHDIIRKLEERIELIGDFQNMSKGINSYMPQTFVGGNARKEELKYVIKLLKGNIE